MVLKAVAHMASAEKEKKRRVYKRVIVNIVDAGIRVLGKKKKKVLLVPSRCWVRLVRSMHLRHQKEVKTKKKHVERRKEKHDLHRFATAHFKEEDVYGRKKKRKNAKARKGRKHEGTNKNALPLEGTQAPQD